jgi:hypothetical protein
VSASRAATRRVVGLSVLPLALVGRSTGRANGCGGAGDGGGGREGRSSYFLICELAAG